MDWSAITALITVLVGLYTAITTRQHASTEIFKAAMEAAKEALEIRDKDITRLQVDAKNSQQRIDFLVQYTAYLSAWVRANASNPNAQPLSYDEYIQLKTTKELK